MAMQSPIGAVYYSTGGSLGNSGSDTVDPYTVSVENNASLLAGLKVLLKMLGSMGTSSGCSIDPVVFKNAVANLNTLIYGGWNWMQGYQTEGILSFFKVRLIASFNSLTLYSCRITLTTLHAISW